MSGLGITSLEGPALVEEAMAGEPSAFGRLVEQHKTRIRALAQIRMQQRQEEVEDLVQEVFCKAYEELSTLRQPARFPDWLMRIAENEIVSWWRKRKVRKQKEETVRIVFQERRERPPDELAERNELAGMVQEALDRMPAACRHVLVLYHFEGYKHREIARFLGLSLANVKLHLARGRASLRRQLEDRVCNLPGRN